MTKEPPTDIQGGWTRKCVPNRSEVIHGAKCMRCPVCNKNTSWDENPFRPFCSNRCKMVDLGEWMEEGYRIAGKDYDDEEPDKKTPDEDT